MKPGLEVLRSLPLLSAFSAHDLALLNGSADLVRFGPGDWLFQAGDRLSECSVLLAGEVGAAHPHTHGQAALVDVVLPVRPLCLPAALLGAPAPVGAQAITSGRLIAFPVDELLEMIRGDPSSGAPFLAHALQEAQEQALQLCALKLRSSGQRLAEFLLNLIVDPHQNPARFVLPFEKRLLAAKVGCSQENLSRAFAALRRIGVQTQRGIVVVRDVTALREFASAASHRQIRI